MKRRRIPTATYRLQFNQGFTLRDAAGLVPYLAKLGISHCYASPYLRARTGSPHGYDIVDHNALNPDIGDMNDLETFVRRLAEHGMGQILDLVPNHMGVFGDDNAWWLDVLENGPAAEAAPYFDIDWHPVKQALQGKLLVPVLGGHYGSALENGELTLWFDAGRGEFCVRYHEHRFPLDPASYPQLIDDRLERLEERLKRDAPAFLELRSLSTAFGHLPARWDTAPEKLEERRRDKEIHKKHLAELCSRSEPIASYLHQTVAAFNGQDEDRRNFDKLHRLLESQAYRLAYWQVASDEINYRRFFDINHLAGLRMENPEVFDATHRFVGELIESGKLDGLRIDHPDGLYDPLAYCRRLKSSVHPPRDAIEQTDPITAPDYYLVVEKILASYERLPGEWPVHGTTGYDFANLVNGLLVYGEAETELTRLYSRFMGHRFDFDELLYERKLLIVEVQLSSELTVLANLLDNIAQTNRHTRDFTLNGLRNALMMVVACFPVYRTYVTAEQVSEEDRRYVEWAVAQAKKRSPAGDVSIFDFIRDILLLEHAQKRSEDNLAGALRFAMKFQQYTAPVMAKALEDTTFYIYNRLVSLNDVGGDPRRFGISLAAFHRNNQERQQHWPYAMIATSTHDAKRSEDVRARINVLSEMPDAWQRHLARWSRINRNKKVVVDGKPAPSRNSEYLLYQTLLGAWPLETLDEQGLAAFRERIREYMLKAVKEAKVHTSWINPNTAYEQAVGQFVEALLGDGSGQNRFLSDFLPFQQLIAHFGMLNSLTQTVLKLTAPGVPDIYQGNELWDFSLVDPDNRRAVDYAKRKTLLKRIEKARNRPALMHQLLENLADGRAKLYITQTLLQLRRRCPELLGEGQYIPLSGEGERADHLCAFARRHDGQTLITVTPRWYARLMACSTDRCIGRTVWGEDRLLLPEPLGAESYENIFSGQLHAPGEGLLVAELLRDFPVGVLIAGAPAM